MKRLIAGLLMFGSVVALLAQASFREIPASFEGRRVFYPVREPMAVQSLNGTWKFRMVNGLELPSDCRTFEQPSFDDRGWTPIQVPGNWETQGFKVPQYGGEIDAVTGLYRTTFRTNPSWKGRHVILRLDGVHFGYELFVNGTKVGEWGSAFNLCQFDITSALLPQGDNLLAIKVTTRSKGWKFDLNDCWALGGITRDVEAFAIPNTYLQDVTFVSEVSRELDATVKVRVEINRFQPEGKASAHTLQVLLSDPLNRQVAMWQSPISADKPTYSFDARLLRPDLWSAETPNLYRLEARIVNDRGVTTQRINERVGIRQVTIEEGILKLNHRPILLRGVCHNEIDPVRGRALTDRERRAQLEQMKAANINYIRTAHYPFHPSFHRMCDEMGFYVCCEVPFGYGDKNLQDITFAPELCARAEATLARDKNRPSILMWSVGNENPYTDAVQQTLQYVKEKDPTRPRGLPMVGGYFVSNKERLGDNVDIYMFHYQSVKSVNTIAAWARKPIILTEYAHGLGLSFDALESQFANIVANPKIAGGAVWCWSDQALLTYRGTQSSTSQDNESNADGVPIELAAFDLKNSIQGVWLDSLRYLDSKDDRGTDGMVYADGYPQEDFFQLRRVYSPILVKTDTLQVGRSGEMRLPLSVENRFDFASLNGYTCRWQLKNYTRTLGRGEEPLHGAVRTVVPITIALQRPVEVLNGDLMLDVQIVDPQGRAVYEKNLPVVVGNEWPRYDRLAVSLPADRRFKALASRKELTVRTLSGTIRLTDKGRLSLVDAAGQSLVETPLLLRVGRPVTVNLDNFGMRRKDLFYWNPYLLEPQVQSFAVEQNKNEATATLRCRWDRVDKAGEWIDGTVVVKIAANGLLHIDYDLAPYNATGSLMECGLTLAMNPSFDTFRWLGFGPYTTTPGKSAYNDRDVWALHRNDFRFLGNRGNVDMAVVTDPSGRGIAVIGENENIGVETLNGRIYLGQNAIVSGYGTKLSPPVFEAEAAKIKQIKGHLLLAIDQPSVPFPLLAPVFKPYPIVVPERPYLQSYGF